MAADVRALLEAARGEASRLETQARRERRWLATAADQRQLVGIHTVASAQDVTDLAQHLTAAVADRGRLHVVVLTDRRPDPGPHHGAQTKDTP